MCKENAFIEVGMGDDAVPVLCNVDYSSYPKQNKCVRENDTSLNYCSHDMVSEEAKCYKCPRGYGHTDTESCSKCPDNCLVCLSSSPYSCTYCDAGYELNGAACTLCDMLSDTFDLQNNKCTAFSSHFLDMDGDPDTVGGIKVFFPNLNSFADSELHVENNFSKFWVANLSTNYYLIRNYQEIPTHKKVSIRMEVFIVDTW